jgi:hypothetical protein
MNAQHRYHRFGKWVLGMVVLARAGFLLAFLADHDVVEAEVQERRDFGVLSRKGVAQQRVKFQDETGWKTETIRWQFSRPPETPRVQIRRARSPFLRTLGASPAPLLETLWLEVFAAGLAVLVAVMAASALGLQKWRARPSPEGSSASF